jgi:hypothetical protein
MGRSLSEIKPISIYFDIGLIGWQTYREQFLSNKVKNNRYIPPLCRLNLAPSGQLSDNGAPFLSV